MKYFKLLPALLVLLGFTAKGQNHYGKADSLSAIMNRYTSGGLPGVVLAVYSDQEGLWTGASGFAKTETRETMSPQHLQYLQSISKSYLAVAVMQLQEQGKINLDLTIDHYLPANTTSYIVNANKITVRMLLNHTSGIAEYSDDPSFVSWVMEHPLQPFSRKKVLETIKKNGSMFMPGTRHKYSNSNYEMLALLTDRITGDHALFIAKNIFDRLHLTQTYYKNTRDYLNNPLIVNSYWDVLNTGHPANITAMQKVNVSSFVGDDGIVCTPADAIHFLRGLESGKLVNSSSLAEMKKWVNDDTGQPIYGLGLVHYAAGGLEGYGHSGGGIGAGCILLYVPAIKTYVFMATNIGTLFEGTLPARAGQLKDELLMTILQ